VWVARGIGITPFLSVLRTMAPGHGRTVRLYYCVRVAAEALFFDELETLAAALVGVTIARFDSAAGARIDASAIRKRPWRRTRRLELLPVRSEADGQCGFRRSEDAGCARPPHPQRGIRAAGEAPGRLRGDRRHPT